MKYLRAGGKTYSRYQNEDGFVDQLSLGEQTEAKVDENEVLAERG